jgi:hypothetical protein
MGASCGTAALALPRLTARRRKEARGTRAPRGRSSGTGLRAGLLATPSDLITLLPLALVVPRGPRFEPLLAPLMHPAPLLTTALVPLLLLALLLGVRCGVSTTATEQ